MPEISHNRQGARTRLKLLKAAEQLFGEHGFHAVSVRQITQRAGVDLALANYHFGSKQNLFHQALKRRSDDISRKRLDALAKACSEFAPAMPDISAIVAAFLDPLFQRLLSPNPGWRSYGRLIAQVAVDDHHSATVEDLLDPAARPFLKAFRLALPNAPSHRIEWTFLFMLGALAQMLAQTDRLDRLTDGTSSGLDLGAARVELSFFLINAFSGCADSPR